jgi:hypothetical protein
VALRTRIALTFILLLAAVLTAALSAVSAANKKNAGDEVQRQLDVGKSVFSNFLKNNNDLLTQAATAVAADYGFRDAVAARDTDTLVSVLENHGTRIGAAMVVLTSLDGHVIAASGSRVATGASFPIEALKGGGTMDQGHARLDEARVIVVGAHIYQVVARQEPATCGMDRDGIRTRCRRCRGTGEDHRARRDAVDAVGPVSLGPGLDACGEHRAWFAHGRCRHQDAADRIAQSG